MIVILTYAVDVPPEFVAVIVYSVRICNVFGVPVISPVDVSKLSPLVNAGLIAQESIAPPELDGETVPITVPLVKVRSFCV